MKSDISNIEQVENIDCVFINDQNNIEVYHRISTQQYKTEFTLFGNKYIEKSQSAVDTIPSTKTCYQVQDFAELPSKYDFIHPIYTLSAIAAFGIIVFVAFQIIIKPFARGGI